MAREVLLVFDAFPDGIRGSGLDLFLGLHDRGWRVRVLARRVSAHAREALAARRLLHLVEAPSASSSFLLDRRSVQRLSVRTSSLVGGSAWLAGWARRGGRIVHHLPESNAWVPSAWLRSATALVVAPDLPSKARSLRFPDAQYRYGSAESDSPYELPLALASPKQAPAARGRRGAFRVLTVAPLTWEAGVEYDLRSVASLARRGVSVEYRVVGKGPLWEHAHFFAHLLGVHPNVRFLGVPERGEVLRQYAWADALLHLGVAGEIPESVLEAQAYGLPVVCSDAPTLAPFLSDAVLVSPARDTEAAVECLLEICRDGISRERTEAGQHWVRAHFPMAKQLDAVERLYATVRKRASL